MRLKALAALVCVVPIVVGALLISGAGSRVRTGSAAPAPRSFRPVGSRPRPASTEALPPGRGALIAEVLVSTNMHVSPRGRVLAAVGPRTEFSSPDVLSVVKVSSGWLGVMSPLAGNGRLGWILESAVVLGRDNYALRASLSSKNLTVLRAGRALAHYTVGIGAPESPTPTGHFAVTDRLLTTDPGGPYGCCILALSATAPHTIPGWTGGNRIAVHATSATETIGQPDSHGCLHVTQAQARWLIYHVPSGTPVTISG